MYLCMYVYINVLYVCMYVYKKETKSCSEPIIINYKKNDQEFNYN